MDFKKHIEDNCKITKMQPQDKVVDFVELDDVVKLLTNDNTIRDYIYRCVEEEYHKEDIRNIIEYMNEYEDTKITLTDELLNDILIDYEDFLGNSEEWHFMLDEAIRRNIDEC